MLNECQFSFSAKDIEKLIASACEGVIVTGKVVYDPEKYTSIFEIYAVNYGTLSAMTVPVIRCRAGKNIGMGKH